MSEHWLQHAHGRIVAGDSEPDVLADYGWVQIADEEREAIEWCLSLPMLDRDAVRMMPLRNLLARLSTPATQATAGEGSVQDGCTLTDEEREAIEASMHGENDATVIATLRNLLERLHT